MLDHIQTIIATAGTQGPRYGVPALIGRPQTGKTTFLKQLAKQHEATAIVLNPALDLPEDLGGFPLMQDGRVSYCRPPMLPDSKTLHWIIVDELDKPRRDVQVALLTLFAERRIRNTRIPDDWVIVAAMNEPRMELEPALVERMLFLPFDLHPTFTSTSLQRIQKRWLPAEAAVRIPERDGSARGSAWRLDAWAQTPAWRTPEVREMVVRGLLNEQAAAIALAELEAVEPKPVLDPVKWIRTKPYTEIAPELCIILCSQTDREVFGQCLVAWKERIEADKTGEWQQLLDVWADSETILLTAPGMDGLAAQAKLDAALTAAGVAVPKPVKKGGKKS